MRELRTRELRSLLDAVLILNSDLDVETLPARVLGAAHKAVSADLACYANIDLTSGTTVHVPAPLIDSWLPESPGWATYMRHQHEDPTIRHFAQNQDAVPRKISDFISDRQFRSLGLYSEVYGPQCIRALIGVPVNDPRKDGRVIGWSMNRSISDFNERDRACLAVLRTHVIQAHRNAEKFARLRSRVDVPSGGGVSEAANEGNSVEVTEPTKGSPRRASVKPKPALTKREAEVLYWVGLGKTNDEIGQIIGAASGTVKKHLEHIYEKLAVRNRAAAVHYVKTVSASSDR